MNTTFCQEVNKYKLFFIEYVDKYFVVYDNGITNTRRWFPMEQYETNVTMKPIELL